MIPIRDNIPSRSTPVVNYLIIGATTLVFLVQLTDEHDGRAELVERYGMIPARVLHPDRPVVHQEVVHIRTPFGVMPMQRRQAIASPPFPAWITLLTCVFLHGGWMHFLGNMWTLYIFGDNVEDRLGKFGYLLFYLGSGVAASVTHMAFSAGSGVPTIGASGAIAGVMGAYFVLYPHARVLTLIPIFLFIQFVMLPAPLFLGLWFILQLFQGTFALAATQAGGVAWWAHVGGFVAGAAIARGLAQRRSAPYVARRVYARATPYTNPGWRPWDQT